MRLSRALLSAVALAAASPLGAVPLAEEGFRVPRESLKTDLKKFCLREVGGDLPRAYFRTRFLWLEQFAAKLLSRAGFESMPSERVEAALAVARTDAGGFYDPFTGRAMAAKREAVANAERLALTEKLGCDATLALELHLVRMRWQDGIGSWDYVQRPMGGGALYVGTGQALSLWLEMRSIQGMALVERAAGIQPVSLVQESWSSGLEWNEAEPQSLLANATWNARAVLTAFGALAPAPTPEVSQCIARVKTKADPMEIRAQCEAEAFEFSPPPETKEPSSPAEPAPQPDAS